MHALIIVDVQNDFCEGGSLAVVGGAAVAAGISAALAADAPDASITDASITDASITDASITDASIIPDGAVAAAGAVTAGTAGAGTIADGRRWDHVVATKDYHIDPGAHFGNPPDFVLSWPVHCVVGTAGTDLHPALDTGRIEAVFTKGEHAAAYSGFEGHSDGIGLADWLRAHDVATVDVVGIATDHCVRATALDAAAAGFGTSVLLDLTAGVTPSTVDTALAELRAAGVELSGSIED